MKTLFFILIFALPSFVHAARITLTQNQEKEFKEKIFSWWGEEVKFIPNLMEGEVVSWAQAGHREKNQTLTAKVTGLHPRSCSKGLRKISRYEDYKSHMSFVSESSYLEKEQIVSFVVDHIALPFPMILKFQLPRITGPGETKFIFPNGIFKDLHGEIKVASVGNRCAYFLTANWSGSSTGLPDLVVETFAQTLIKIGLEHLIRISSL
ncbi:MAG: hypothetical protein K2P81_09265 [Bacteriovoracaceae bacterium]|nr:hypothetical protein [Bacteriovoracaceae bacterium]